MNDTIGLYRIRNRFCAATEEYLQNWKHLYADHNNIRSNIRKVVSYIPNNITRLDIEDCLLSRRLDVSKYINLEHIRIDTVSSLFLEGVNSKVKITLTFPPSDGLEVFEGDKNNREEITEEIIREIEQKFVHHKKNYARDLEEYLNGKR